VRVYKPSLEKVIIYNNRLQAWIKQKAKRTEEPKHL